jgi:hypothetical protein
VDLNTLRAVYKGTLLELIEERALAREGKLAGGPISAPVTCQSPVTAHISARHGLSSPLVEECTRKWLLLKELAHFRKEVFHCGIVSAWKGKRDCDAGSKEKAPEEWKEALSRWSVKRFVNGSDHSALLPVICYLFILCDGLSGSKPNRER